MITVDCKGLLCPRPLIEAKKAFTQAPIGETLVIVVDNETAVFNLTSYFTGNGIESNTKMEGSLHLVTVTKGISQHDTLEKSRPEEYCQIPQENPQTENTVVLIASDKMGDGDPELGTILMKGFFVALAETETVPQEVIFYNSGVLLTTKHSAIIQSLEQLKAKGVQITACGTCADFYDIKRSIEIATISNMYSIVTAINLAKKVIRP
jgi:selenium metabolism protein YedF